MKHNPLNWEFGVDFRRREMWPAWVPRRRIRYYDKKLLDKARPMLENMAPLAILRPDLHAIRSSRTAHFSRLAEPGDWKGD